MVGYLFLNAGLSLRTTAEAKSLAHPWHRFLVGRRSADPKSKACELGRVVVEGHHSAHRTTDSMSI